LIIPTVSLIIGSLEEVLHPEMFFKIHRSQIINQQHLQSIQTYSKNRLELQLSGVKERGITSSSTTPEFRKWLDH